MSPSRSREFILVLIAFALGAGSLLVAGSALAQQPATAAFRIEQRWHGFPDPPVTPGGAGMYQGYILPYTLPGAVGKPGAYELPPGTAGVAIGNPIGAAFTLPASVFTSYYTDTLTPMNNWPGYTTTYFYHAYNGRGVFAPNVGNPTATSNNPYRVVFPTTQGNPVPNYGYGNPATPTTTFDGNYDDYRKGSLWVTPGENRFGGTFRLFFLDTSHWDQFISYITPFYYTGYGSYFCFDDGKYTVTPNQGTPHCTPDAHTSEPGTTAIYKGIWWLLADKNRAPPHGNGAKQTTPTAVRQSTYPTLTPNGNASYLRRSQHYLNLIHPWTTGTATAVNAEGTPGTGIITPMATGYDITLGGATITIPKKNYNGTYDSTAMAWIYNTTTPYVQTLQGVTRVVSMVRPRLTWTMAMPIDPVNNVIENIWTNVRMRRLTVYFLPEPAGMLMLGIGSAALLGLSRIRRR